MNKQWKFISDVDGVLTNGNYIYSKHGKECKIFGAHDNDGVKLLKSHDVLIQFISADKRGFDISIKRISDMDCTLRYCSEKDRVKYIENEKVKYNIIYMGDGIHDVPALQMANIPIAPNNARPEVKMVPNIYVTPSIGGQGAFLDAALYVINEIDCKDQEVERELSIHNIAKTMTSMICDSFNRKQLDDKVEQFIVQMIDRNVCYDNFKIVGVGAGRVGYALRAFIMRLNHFGFNASFIGDTNVPALNKYDMLLVASTSGQTPTILYYTEVGYSKQNCYIVSFTGDQDSPIARLSNLHIKLDLSDSKMYIMKTYGELMLNILFDSIIEQMLTLEQQFDPQIICNNHSNLE